MFKKITLKNFRKHRDLTLTFQGGLESITGSNENGKTTVSEALRYALFGARALRSSIDDTVTYDEPVNSLKVVLVLEVEGTEYTVSRGKSGCELTYGTQAVTGQTEVSNFVAKLLGFDLAGAGSLALADQNSLRGALDEGPKAATELIESLANFQQIDDLIELMQAKLTLGSAAVLESRLAQAQKLVGDLQGVVKPDLDAVAENIDTLSKGAVEAKFVTGTLHNAFVSAKEQADVAAAAKRAHQSAVKAHADALVDVKKAEDSLARAEELATKCRTMPVIEACITSAEASRTAQAAHSDVKRLHTQVNPLLSYSGPVFEGSEEALVEYIKASHKHIQTLMASRNALKQEIAVLEASIQAGACSLCGKDVSEVPEVVEKNTRFNARILTLISEVKALAESITAEKEDVAEHEEVLKGAKPYLDMAARGLPQVQADRATVPPTLFWTGPDTSLPADGTDYARVLMDLRGELASNAAALAALKGAKGTKDLAVSNALRTSQALAESPDVDVARVTAAAQAAQEAHLQAKRKQEDLEDSVRTAVAEHTKLDFEWKASQRNLDNAKVSVESIQAELKTLAFNNALLKRVREVRPVLADRVWALVLGSISKYFSEMRGTPSRVTKGAEGFTVDGHPVKSLSGSTLDILGLAIRCSLLRMFLPTLSFIILDEPFHGCDDGRTQAMLTFLSQLGLKQVLLVTHEATSVALADNLLTIGE